MYFHHKSLSCLVALAASLDYLSTDSQRHGKALAFSVGIPQRFSSNNNRLPSTRTKFTNRQQQSNEPFLFASKESSSRLFVEDTNSASEAIESALDDLLLEEITEDEVNILHPSGDDDVDGVNPISDKGDTDLDDANTDDEPLVLCDVPPASHSIQVTNDGPAGSPVTTLTVHLGMPGHPEPLIIQTGKIGRQAAGAVTLSRGDTILYTTASRDKDPKESIDFLPLSVEHQERFSSAGLTSGSYNRRDGRPAEHEVLTCRLIDRPLRPLIADGWRHETQLLSWVLSYDGERSCDPLAITASSAALWISDVPLLKPVAAAMVGYIDGQYVLNPTNRQMEKSKLNLTVAGTKDAVLMIEGAADFLPEEIMIEAVSFGHEAIKTICVALEEFGAAVGKEKNYSTLVKPIEGLQEEVNEALGEKVEDLWSAKGGKKENLSANMSALSKEAWSMFEGKYPEQKNEVMKCFKNLLSKKLYEKAKKEGIRCDGRRLDEIRNIDIETSILPKVHGSALFTRGETQAIATATLGDSGMKQKIDRLDGMEKKRFYLQYSFPPSCVGETGRVGAPGRREIGHGNLAERALAAIIPPENEFPYSIRVESLITESNGSSSMASVCGGCLALMDAGVPIKSPVAGIAMGMLLDDTHSVSDDDAVIVSDILGTEDGLGTMDFKVAGDKTGITTFQLDIKCEGLTIETMSRALQQAKEGRIHILDKMNSALTTYREDLPQTVPRIRKFNIPADSIGKVIGPGGKQIRAVIEDFDLINMDVEEDGEIQISSLQSDKLEKAEEFVMDLIKAGGGRGEKGGKGSKAVYAGPEPEEGAIYKGKITGIHQFGVFVEILPGAEDGSTPGLEGLCHVSELHIERVRNCEGFMKSLGIEEMEVRYIGKNSKGQLQLSRKSVLEERKNGGKKNDDTIPVQKMSAEEVDVIAQAIEGIKDL